jgi:hypothetical protein
LFLFLLAGVPTFLLGVAGILRVNDWGVIPWPVMIALYFFFIETRILCSHCPHYAGAGNTLKCLANYGAPKLFRYRFGPMSRAEKALLLGCIFVLLGYPLFFMVPGGQGALAVLYAVSAAGHVLFLRRRFCTRCINFFCPLNAVRKDHRKVFLERNPEIARILGEG